MTVLTTRPQTDIPLDGAAAGPDRVGTVLISRGGTICRHGRFSRKGSGSGVFSKWEGGVHECRPTQGDAEGFDRNACSSEEQTSELQSLMRISYAALRL